MSFIQIERRINQGDHLCSFYENRVEQFQIVIPFIVEGLKKNEKCLYIADENAVAEIIGGLALHGIDVNQLIVTGQLQIITAKHSYLRSGRFVMDNMISQLEVFSESAEKEGYKGSRVAGEVTWLARQLDSLNEFFEYESILNSIFYGKPIKLLCQYNSKKLFGDIIVKALQTHKRVLIGLNLFESSFYKQH